MERPVMTDIKIFPARALALPLAIPFALSTLAISTNTHAAELRFDGFATFMVGQVLDDKELVRAPDGGVTPFRGFDDQINYQSNNVFALQARADLGDGLSATAQIMAKGVDDYDAEFNWAYLSYDLNPEWTVSVGRFRIPFFMYSDSLDVGYSYHFVKPPFNTYDIGGFDTLNGVKLEWQTDIGVWTSRMTFLTGRSDTKLNIETQLEPADGQIARAGLFAWNMNWDWLTLRAIYTRASLSMDLKNFLDIQLASIPFSPKAMDAVYVDNDKAEFYGVGLQFDPGPYFIVAESTVLDIRDSLLQRPGQRSYISAGARLGKFTPYFIVEHAESDYNEKSFKLLANEATQAAMGQIPGLDYGTAFGLVRSELMPLFTATLNEQDAWSVGVRWDFHPSADLKIEYMTTNDNTNHVDPEAIAIAVDVIF
ncbi:Conserved hypothetical protein [gamma proteobacterium HdN1]|nr:Conserved hypothetical protein [gamma proteobacterium HdN1]